jgi:hypothetical protein
MTLANLATSDESVVCACSLTLELSSNKDLSADTEPLVELSAALKVESQAVDETDTDFTASGTRQITSVKGTDLQ